jgi:hypothetical protein
MYSYVAIYYSAGTTGANLADTDLSLAAVKLEVSIAEAAERAPSTLAASTVVSYVFDSVMYTVYVAIAILPLSF